MTYMLHITMRIIQFLVFIGTFFLLYRIYREKNTTRQRMLLLASICAVINIYGYLEALSVDSRQGSEWSVRLQYVSMLMFFAFMLHLMVMFCEINIRKWQIALLWACNGFFLTMLFTEENYKVLFYDYSYVSQPLAMQIRFRFLPLGYVFMGYVALLILAILYVGIVVRQTMQKDSVVTIVSIVAILPGVAYVLNLAGVTGGFDFGSILMPLACLLIYHFNKNYHLLDDGQIAREVILDELGEGYIILDRERRVKSYNMIAAMLYPELEQPGESEMIVELIFLHNHDVLEHNGKICNIVVSDLKEGGDLIGYVTWIYDCTDEYYYMKDLQQIQEQAIHSDQEKDLFLYHMTHGFGSPLHIIKNRSDAVYQDDRSSDDVREMTLEILEAGQKLEDMIALMMDQSDEEVRNGLQETEYDTKELLESLRSMLEERRQGRCREVRFSDDPRLPARWYGDKSGIESVVNNILHGAGIVSRIAGLEMDVSFETRYTDTLLVITLYLSDKGATTAEINRLESREQKGDKNLAMEVNYISYKLCRRLLLQMKGTMECGVDLDKSRIRLMLPQQVIDNVPYGSGSQGVEEAEGAAAPARETAAFGGAQPTVMVVDDNVLYLKEINSWLRKLQLKTIMAKSGSECLQILGRRRVDLIFMDQMMPEMDGTQTLRKIRRLEEEQGAEKPVPVVLLTADDMAGARKRYLESGFSDYVVKPIEPQQLQDQVRQHLRMRSRG